MVRPTDPSRLAEGLNVVIARVPSAFEARCFQCVPPPVRPRMIARSPVEYKNAAQCKSASASCAWVSGGNVAISTDHVNAHSGHLIVRTVALLMYSRT